MLKYRPDIDGLRALAVVPVVLFHAGIPFFSGGFVGVDIFFVISGYLITALILQDLSNKKFSIFEFYVRRARRILPALLAVVTITLAASFFLLLPDELGETSKAARRIAFFASNHLFWQGANDYWQQNILSNQPLLHTWSLAVEEQFYLVMPLLLLLCQKLHKRLAAAGILLALAVTSFSISQYWLISQPAASFYLLPSRAFELLIGSFLALLLQYGNNSKSIINEIVGSIGIIFIVISVFFYHEKMAFPGVAALLPCFGAAAIIYTGANTNSCNISWINKLFKTRPLVFIGLISYSLYLWHWPALLLFRSVGWYAWGLPKVPTALQLAGIFVLAWASWRWIELPFRQGKLQVFSHANPSTPLTHKVTRQLFAGQHRLIAASCMLGALLLCWGTGATFKRIVALQPTAPALLEFNRETSIIPGIKCEGKTSPDIIADGMAGCVLGNANLGIDKSQFIILGDSHARMWADGLNILGEEHKKSVLMLAYSGCTPLLDYVAPTRKECVDIFKNTLGYAIKSPIKNVVLGGYWIYAMESMSNNESFYSSLEKTVLKLKEAEKNVYILRDIPELESELALRDKFIENLRTSGNSTLISATNYQKRQLGVNTIINELSIKYSIFILDPTLLTCKIETAEGGCMVAKNGRTLYRDKHHLTDDASITFRKIFDPLFK